MIYQLGLVHVHCPLILYLYLMNSLTAVFTLWLQAFCCFYDSLPLAIQLLCPGGFWLRCCLCVRPFCPILQCVCKAVQISANNLHNRPNWVFKWLIYIIQMSIWHFSSVSAYVLSLRIVPWCTVKARMEPMARGGYMMIFLSRAPAKHIHMCALCWYSGGVPLREAMCDKVPFSFVYSLADWDAYMFVCNAWREIVLRSGPSR